MAPVELLRHFFREYGYWTMLGALLLENAGVPLPGETTLLVASFLAYTHHLELRYVILVGIAAATLGDNLGYTIGRYGGRPFVERYQRFFHISPAALARGERLFERHGAFTVFFARFVFGMRVITGPLAGTLRMEARRFALFNFFGAVVWVTAIASAGYFFGSQARDVFRFFKRFDLALLAAAVLVALVWMWRRHRAKRNTSAAGSG